MLNARSIQGIATLVVGIFISLWLGMSLVTNQTETVLKVGAGALLLLCAMLGPRIWLLAIFLMSMQIPIIRGFTTAELGQGLLFGFCTLLFLMRRLPMAGSFDELSWWRLLMALVIFQVYVRHPVGLNIFGAGNVGARPYFLFILAFLMSFFLGNLRVKPGELKWAMGLSIAASLISIPLSSLRMRGAAPSDEPAFGAAHDEEGATRIGPLAQVAGSIPSWVVCYVSPLRGLLHPLWGPLILISIVAAAASGYRNAVAAVGLTYLVGIAYRGGFGQVMLASFLGILGLGALAIWNVIAPMPPNIQRALSPFPGTWEERYTEQASTSTEWRVEMWKEALFTDKWIENKWLGDGIGFSRLELQRMASLDEKQSYHTISGLTVQQEGMMISGSYHSGPVQSIRAVGYLGLAVLLMGMIRVTIHAHRQIIRCRGTEWFPVAIFFCLPSIVTPILFIFIFGEFRSGVISLCYNCAIVNLLQKNIPLPAWNKASWRPYILQRRPDLVAT